MDGQDEGKYRQKMMLKAEIIVGAANRLWGKRDREKDGLGCIANGRQGSNSKSRLKWTFDLLFRHNLRVLLDTSAMEEGRKEVEGTRGSRDHTEARGRLGSVA